MNTKNTLTFEQWCEKETGEVVTETNLGEVLEKYYEKYFEYQMEEDKKERIESGKSTAEIIQELEGMDPPSCIIEDCIAESEKIRRLISYQVKEVRRHADSINYIADKVNLSIIKAHVKAVRDSLNTIGLLINKQRAVDE